MYRPNNQDWNISISYDYKKGSPEGCCALKEAILVDGTWRLHPDTADGRSFCPVGCNVHHMTSLGQQALHALHHVATCPAAMKMWGITGLACMEVLEKVGMAFEGMQLVAHIECSLMRYFGIPHIKGIASVERIFK